MRRDAARQTAGAAAGGEPGGRRNVGSLATLAGGGAAALASAAASICCAGPFAIALLGVNGAIWAAGMKPYRPWLLGVGALLLAVGFWGVYGAPARAAGSGPGAGAAARPACSPRFRRLTRLALWVSLAAWVGAVLTGFAADRYWL